MKSKLLLPLLLATAAPALAQSAAPEPTWAFEESDVPVDPAFKFGELANGMRYVLRENHTPEDTVLVRLRIASGSLEERDDERGLAHYLEHMAFNGSKRIPEGEMVKLLEREGLAFGADTNASTGFETVTYKLDLPRNDPKLIDTALMIMRETASELTISDEAVERERGVILAEKRDRTNYALKELEDEWAFSSPGARFTQRLPIGTDETLRAANAARLRALYERTYVPGNAVLIVVGAIDVAAVEAHIRERFADWRAAPVPAQSVTGPVDLTRKGQSDIYLDPALSERVTVTRLSQWTDEPDTISQRRENLLRAIGYGALNRRLETISRSDDAPYRGAGFGTGAVFEDGRATNLIVDAVDGRWADGLAVAAREWRRALEFGFTEAEIAEQVARTRQASRNAAASANTRSNTALVGTIEALLSNDTVPSTPESSLERFEAFAPSITAEAVLAALRADAAPLDDPLIRFQGRTEPVGGTEALRAAWNAAMGETLAAPAQAAATEFAYTGFGQPGSVIADAVEPRTGIRMVRFANGVRLNLKKTSLEADRVRYQLNLDGGSLLNTRENPLATAMVGSLTAGGLGKHSQDELESVLAGRTVGLNLSSSGETFVSTGTTTPDDLELQLQLVAAALTDPGYRREGEVRYRREMSNWFKRKDATPSGALGAAIGGILSDNDPRFTVQPEADYQTLSFEQLRKAVGDRLGEGAIEIALVGDLDEQAAITLVGQTLGALPAREGDFLARETARQRSFTADRAARTVTHRGEADQALLHWIWPTTDDSDHHEVLRLELVERVVRLELTEELRERLGKAYSPSASSAASSVWRGYGTFSLAASVDSADIDATRAALRAVIGRLVSEPVSADTLDRARRPVLEGYDNALKTNGGWMSLAARAQSEGHRIDRFLAAKALLEEIEPADLQSTAERYLAPGQALEVLTLPEGKTAA